MPTNLELKARFRNSGLLVSALRKIGARKKELLRQTDTYFHFRPGRLKLRETGNSRSELIWYHRPNAARNRYSEFSRIPVGDPRTVKRVLARKLGVRAVVKKERRLYMFKNARIHVDRVEGLGTFLEFEVLVTKGRPQAQHLLSFLKQALDIKPGLVLVSSYGDLMHRAKPKQ